MEDDILARLLSMPNVIITSHQAFLTVEALNNIAQTSVNNMDEIFKNNKLFLTLTNRHKGVIIYFSK